MTRTELRAFLKTGVDELNPATEFGYGLASDFTSKTDNSYPMVWWVTKDATTSDIIPSTQAPLDHWPVKLWIAKKDSMDSVPAQYEDIVDQCDVIAQKLAYKFNQSVAGYKTLTLESITRQPFIKQKHPDCIAGVELTFTLNSVSTVSDCT